MDLKTFISIFWRRKWVIGITAALTLMVTILGLSFLTPSYSASTTLRIGTATGGSTDYVSYDILYTDRLMNTYKTIVTSNQTAVDVKERLGLAEPVELSVSIPANTELMSVSASHTSPVVAAAAANAAAEILISQAAELNSPSGESSQEILQSQLEELQAEIDQARARLDQLSAATPPDQDAITAAQESIARREQTYASLLQQYDRARFSESVRSNQISVVQQAVAPSAPANPSKTLLIPLGLLIGLAGGLGLAFLFENLDTTLYSTAQIERLADVPVVARIPMDRSARQASIFGPRTVQEEAFRRLRTNLLALDVEEPTSSILVTSSEPADGKSTVAANLAVTLAQAGRTVVVVDADLRKPAIHTAFGLPNVVGVTEALSGVSTLDEVLQFAMIPGVQVITSGQPTPSPAELLGLPQMRQLVEDLQERFDTVIFDAPSLQTVTDAGVLAPLVDGVLLVVARGHSRQESVRSALQHLTSLRIKPLGLIVNRAEHGGSFHYDRPPESTPEVEVKTVAASGTPTPLPTLGDIQDDVTIKPEIIERLQNVTRLDAHRATRAMPVATDQSVSEPRSKPAAPATLRRLTVVSSSGIMGEEERWHPNHERTAREG